MGVTFDSHSNREDEVEYNRELIINPGDGIQIPSPRHLNKASSSQEEETLPILIDFSRPLPETAQKILYALLIAYPGNDKFNRKITKPLKQDRIDRYPLKINKSHKIPDQYLGKQNIQLSHSLVRFADLKADQNYLSINTPITYTSNFHIIERNVLSKGKENSVRVILREIILDPVTQLATVKELPQPSVVKSEIRDIIPRRQVLKVETANSKSSSLISSTDSSDSEDNESAFNENNNNGQSPHHSVPDLRSAFSEKLEIEQAAIESVNLPPAQEELCYDIQSLVITQALFPDTQVHISPAQENKNQFKQRTLQKFIGGVDLSKLDISKLTAKEKIKLFRNLLSPLKKIHEQGFVHGDVKGGNIKTNNNLRSQIFDCDRSTSIGQKYKKNIALGSLQNTPAECWEAYFADIENPFSPDPKFNASVKRDTYSLGILLFQILVGSFDVYPEELKNHWEKEEIINPVPSTKASHPYSSYLRPVTTPQKVRQYRFPKKAEWKEETKQAWDEANAKIQEFYSTGWFEPCSAELFQSADHNFRGEQQRQLAAFIKRCLDINPENRPTDQECEDLLATITEGLNKQTQTRLANIEKINDTVTQNEQKKLAGYHPRLKVWFKDLIGIKDPQTWFKNINSKKEFTEQKGICEKYGLTQPFIDYLQNQYHANPKAGYEQLTTFLEALEKQNDIDATIQYKSYVGAPPVLDAKNQAVMNEFEEIKRKLPLLTPQACTWFKEPKQVEDAQSWFDAINNDPDLLDSKLKCQKYNINQEIIARFQETFVGKPQQACEELNKILAALVNIDNAIDIIQYRSPNPFGRAQKVAAITKAKNAAVEQLKTKALDYYTFINYVPPQQGNSSATQNLSIIDALAIKRSPKIFGIDFAPLCNKFSKLFSNSNTTPRSRDLFNAIDCAPKIQVLLKV